MVKVFTHEPRSGRSEASDKLLTVKARYNRNEFVLVADKDGGFPTRGFIMGRPSLVFDTP